ncbi:hypothetical protein ANCCAN_29924 [Ancylostoma caninum]|uniref:Uncharacterized protein n=1 Tax=Ancylostoma caninum TaxID=29170 RepID=A0A368EZZ7_ANCCA|nr:hypothetical protein ANCCAN_29924 [Ancylostoma caninum]
MSFFFGGDEGSSSDDGEDDQLKKSKRSEKKPLTMFSHIRTDINVQAQLDVFPVQDQF